MGRPRRMLVEGGVYHVYNRVARGGMAFADGGEAARFVGLIRKLKQQDGLGVLAWGVLSNHYHLAVRMGSVPLSRTMQALHQSFTRSYNGRHEVYGPFWQGRYKAKAVRDPRYLMQLVLYIHSNPRAAGVAEDLASYPWSGHREVLRRSGGGLLDVDEMLLIFGETRRAARRTYLASLEGAPDQEWFGGVPGSLPWWRLGRPRREVDEELEIDPERPRIDAQGRSTAVERPALEAAAYVELAARALGLSDEQIRAKTRSEELQEARDRLVLVGVERYRLMVKELAQVIGRCPDTVSTWLGRAVRRRGSDAGFARGLDELDRQVAELGWRRLG